MSDPATAMRLPPTIEDCVLQIVHSLALVSRSADSLTTAGYAITNSQVCRRNQILALREAIISLRELEHRLPILHDELTTLLRRLDPLSEMLPEGRA